MSEEKKITLNSELEPKDDAKKRKIAIFSILAVLLIVVGILIVNNIKLNDEREQQEKALTTAYLQLDSLSNELDERILTISQLGGEIDTLLSIKAQLETEKKDLLDQDKRRQRTIRDLRDKVEGYQELLLIKDEEIKQLTQINEQLMTENNDLKVETQELNQNIRDINSEKASLEEKVEILSKLKIEDFKVFAVSEKGKERPDEFRRRHIGQLKIQFAVAENKVAPIEGKELWVRVIAPDGNVLFDVSRGSGTFMFEGREMFFSEKKDILFDRNKQAVTVYYDKGSEYAIGQHIVEIYTDDYLMGKGTFIVKS